MLKNVIAVRPQKSKNFVCIGLFERIVSEKGKQRRDLLRGEAGDYFLFNLYEVNPGGSFDLPDPFNNLYQRLVKSRECVFDAT